MDIKCTGPIQEISLGGGGRLTYLIICLFAVVVISLSPYVLQWLMVSAFYGSFVYISHYCGFLVGVCTIFCRLYFELIINVGRY